MAYFPFFIDIGGRKILVVGGGNVALGKVEKLLPFGADITVTAPEICPELEKVQGIKLVRRRFADEDINGTFAVIAATDDRNTNAHIYSVCTSRGILVNSVDDPANCGFIFPSLVKAGNVTVGISTSGTAPAFAKYLRKRAESGLDSFTLGIGEMLARFRPRIKELFPTEKHRAGAADALIDLCLRENTLPSDEAAENLLRELKETYDDKDRHA